VATADAYCERHAPERHYDTPEWRALSARMIRIRGRCQRCGSTTELQLDEIVPRSLGGTWDDANLRVLCADCHRRIGRRADRPTVPPSRNLSATRPPRITQPVSSSRGQVARRRSRPMAIPSGRH
jgi:5-methylcytosine-specific restriction endonuclease McrA